MEHQFETLVFDITKNLESYIGLTKKIYEKFSNLPTEEKTNPIYDKNYSKFTDYCKNICGEDIIFEVFSYRNTYITRFNIDIKVDLNGADIIKKTETLNL
jgi:hypothetical protein